MGKKKKKFALAGIRTRIAGVEIRALDHSTTQPWTEVTFLYTLYQQAIRIWVESLKVLFPSI